MSKSTVTATVVVTDAETAGFGEFSVYGYLAVATNDTAYSHEPNKRNDTDFVGAAFPTSIFPVGYSATGSARRLVQDFIAATPDGGAPKYSYYIDDIVSTGGVGCGSPITYRGNTREVRYGTDVNNIAVTAPDATPYTLKTQPFSPEIAYTVQFPVGSSTNFTRAGLAAASDYSVALGIAGSARYLSMMWWNRPPDGFPGVFPAGLLMRQLVSTVIVQDLTVPPFSPGYTAVFTGSYLWRDLYNSSGNYQYAVKESGYQCQALPLVLRPGRGTYRAIRWYPDWRAETPLLPEVPLKRTTRPATMEGVTYETPEALITELEALYGVSPGSVADVRGWSIGKPFPNGPVIYRGFGFQTVAGPLQTHNDIRDDGRYLSSWAWNQETGEFTPVWRYRRHKTVRLSPVLTETLTIPGGTVAAMPPCAPLDAYLGSPVFTTNLTSSPGVDGVSANLKWTAEVGQPVTSVVHYPHLYAEKLDSPSTKYDAVVVQPTPAIPTPYAVVDGVPNEAFAAFLVANEITLEELVLYLESLPMTLEDYLNLFGTPASPGENLDVDPL